MPLKFLNLLGLEKKTPTKKNLSLEKRIHLTQDPVKDGAYYLKKIGPYIPINKRIEQYELAESAFREFFDIQTFCLDNCINGEYALLNPSKKIDPKFGCCDSNHYDRFMTIKDVFLKLQEENQITTHPKTGGCHYHTTNGCSLPKYKPPVCVSFACYPFQQELVEKYNIHYNYEVYHTPFYFMKRILYGKITDEKLTIFINVLKKATQRIKEIKAGNNPNMREELVLEYHD
jgi:hypothetical protein